MQNAAQGNPISESDGESAARLACVVHGFQQPLATAGRNARALGYCLMALALGLCHISTPRVALAQPAAGATVREVRFEGLEDVSTSYVQSVVSTAAGSAYDSAVADADVTRLLATGKFAAASHRTEPVEGGVAVVFELRQRPRITAIRFEGNEKYSDKDLFKEVPLQVDDPVDTFRVREGADAILLKYRDAGFGQANVTYDDELLSETGELVYTIEEGPRIRIREIIFEGNENIADGELRKKVATKTYLWLLRDGKFDEDTVEADAATLQSYYRDQGYLDARVSYRLEFSEGQQNLTVVFSIVEGTRYLIESIDFDGNTVFNDDQLLAWMDLGVGDPMLQDRLDRSVRTIQEKYGEVGYIYARVRAVRIFSETPGYVLITIEIEEGEQYRVGRIVPRGNERTKDKVVRRALELYPEQLFNMSRLREAEDTLRQTRLFESASVVPVGEESGVRDILMNVEESRKAGDFLFGFGVTSNSGLVGSIVLDLMNFDLFDVPRTFGEFVKLQSFHGAGQRLRLEAQPGTELTRFRLDFTEPYLMDKPLRFDASVYYFERGREAYDERRVGGNISFGKRITKGWLRDWYGELAFRLESVRVSDVEPLAASDIRDDEGSTALTSVKATLVRDRTDNRFIPTRGDRFRLSYEQFGVFGGPLFGKATGSYTWHKTLRVDEQERKSVLSLKGVGGYIIGDSPVFERYYAGGIGSIRGFDFRGVSPRQGVRDDPIGGELMLLFSTEYSFPLYGKLLRGLVFTDMGTVESGFELTQWRVAVGAGVRLQVDFFGPVPLEFDIAAPVVRDGDDEEQVFSFFIGATF